jgi:hypothetical protein
MAAPAARQLILARPGRLASAIGLTPNVLGPALRLVLLTRNSHCLDAFAVAQLPFNVVVKRWELIAFLGGAASKVTGNAFRPTR